MTSSRRNERGRPDDASGKGATDTCFAHLSADTGSDVIEKGIDPITNKTLHDLFPRERTAWETFLAGIVRHAIIEPSSAWAHMIPFPEEGDVAVVCCSSVKDLSQKLCQAYATTHLYYTLFRDLGMIYVIEYKEQDHKRLIILLPFSTYHLPTDLPERLEQIKTRSKNKDVHHLVNGILSHRSRLARQETTVQPDRYQESPRGNQQEIAYHAIQQILSSEGVADPDGRIVARIIAEMGCLSSGDVGDSFAKVSVDQERQYQMVQRSDVAEDTTCADPANSSSYDITLQGAALSIRRQKVGVLASSPSPLDSHLSQDSQHSLSQESHWSFLGGTTLQASAIHPATNLLTDEASRDSVSLVSINGIGHTVITPADSDHTDTRSAEQERQEEAKLLSPMHALSTQEIRAQAIALTVCIEGKPNNFPAFIKLLKLYDSQIMSAAVIATLVRKHFPCGLGPLRKPGGYFTKRCQEYGQTTIPDRIMALVHTYESRSYWEIDRLLSQQAQEQKTHSTSALSLFPVVGMVDDMQGLPPPKRGTWMNRQTAEALAARIPKEAPGAKIAGVRDVQWGQEMVSVVDTSVEGILWTITSQEDWLDHIASIRQLEASLAPSGNSSIVGSREHTAMLTSGK